MTVIIDPLTTSEKRFNEPGAGVLRTLGIALVALGVLAIALPQAATLASEILVGLALLLAGLLGLAVTRLTRHFTGWGAGGLLALVTLLAGVFLLVSPEAGGRVLTALLALLCLLEGILYCVFGMRRRARGRAPTGAGWLIANGCASLFVAVLIIAGWPASAGWVIGLLVGVKLVASGLSLTIFAGMVEALESLFEQDGT